MRTLIIGGNTRGIGDAYSDYRRYQLNQIVGECKPLLEELDVRGREFDLEQYMLSNGPFDEIVYSAGVSQLSWIKDITRSRMDDVLDVNTIGPILVASAHVRAFSEHPVRYVVVCSDAATTPMRGSISYCVSKAGAEMAVRCMARELAPLWTVVGISPGVVEDTAMTRKLAEDIPEFRGWTPEQAREYEGVPPIGRRVLMREVAETIAFALTGPQALNGSILTINGGK